MAWIYLEMAVYTLKHFIVKRVIYLLFGEKKAPRERRFFGRLAN
ncbi:hypothetical protein SKA34_00480 [Photobacterium sp. SKA34]|nr:hypothetical protein SKA34_00480 [Photobacterium sp. SKA34]